MRQVRVFSSSITGTTVYMFPKFSPSKRPFVFLFKVVVIFLFVGLLAAGIYGSFQVEDGLELTDVVPQGTVAHKFVDAQFKYFSFYPMALVTQEGFDYPNRQKTFYSYHEAFKEVSC